jgi:hypothetical protein
MPLSDYQITWNNAITIGNTTNYQILNIDGLGGISPLRVQDENRGYIDGSYTGRDFYDERTVTIDVLILGDATHSAQWYYLNFQKQFAPQPLGYYVDPTGATPAANQLKLFQFQLTTETVTGSSSPTKRMYGRVRNITTALNADFTYGYIETKLEIVFPDPRYYDDTVTGTVTGTSGTLSNYGWAISCPVITIASCNTSGSIVCGGTTMDFGNIPASGSLIIDTLQRVIYYLGVPSRNYMLATSTGWIDIAPNTSATITSTMGSMSIPYRNAFV